MADNPLRKVEEPMTRTQSIRRPAFTLVEMLVVISIIGILAGLITAGAMSAIKKARVTTITTELSQMDMAAKSCRDQFGAFPPDGSIPKNYNDDPNTGIPGIPDDFERFFRRAFPRADLQSELLKLKNNLMVPNINFYGPPDNYNPQTAMVFWLGGMPEDLYDQNRITNKLSLNPKSRLIGFSKNPLCPLSDNSTSRIGPFYDFQSSRFKDPMPDPKDLSKSLTFFRAILPPVNTPTDRPYTYFRAESSQRYQEYVYFIPDPPNLPTPVLKIDVSGAKPYWNVQSKGFLNPSSCQILCAGLDGEFGACHAFPTGTWQNKPVFYDTSDEPNTYNPANLDDQANFLQGTLKDAEP
jgi:prepilin-type N-terminal cleavage/methylation domain-containing protein